jgi:hypothetical protein
MSLFAVQLYRTRSNGSSVGGLLDLTERCVSVRVTVEGQAPMLEMCFSWDMDIPSASDISENVNFHYPSGASGLSITSAFPNVDLLTESASGDAEACACSFTQHCRSGEHEEAPLHVQTVEFLYS